MEGRGRAALRTTPVVAATWPSGGDGSNSAAAQQRKCEIRSLITRARGHGPLEGAWLPLRVSGRVGGGWLVGGRVTRRTPKAAAVHSTARGAKKQREIREKRRSGRRHFGYPTAHARASPLLVPRPRECARADGCGAWVALTKCPQ